MPRFEPLMNLDYIKARQESPELQFWDKIVDKLKYSILLL
jgi:hypothetical protein